MTDSTIFNRIPVDEEWADRIDKVANDLAEELKSFIVIIGTQIGKKTVIAAAADDAIPEYVAIQKDMPKFFSMMAAICEVRKAEGISPEPETPKVGSPGQPQTFAEIWEAAAVALAPDECSEEFAGFLRHVFYLGASSLMMIQEAFHKACKEGMTLAESKERLGLFHDEIRAYMVMVNSMQERH